MKQRQIFKVKYGINHNSGAKWITVKNIYALSEEGAIEVIKWLKNPYDISVISIKSLGYVGPMIEEDRNVLGDF
jgi:hypothetical protein